MAETQVCIFSVRKKGLREPYRKFIGWCIAADRKDFEKEYLRICNGTNYKLSVQTLFTNANRIHNDYGQELIHMAIDIASGSIWATSLDHDPIVKYIKEREGKFELCQDCCRRAKMEDLEQMNTVPKFAWD